MAKKCIVADGYIVAGRTGGEELTDRDIDHVDALLGSGRIIPAPAKSSGNMKAVNADVPKEDESNG